MPMQNLTDAPRDALTRAQVVALLQDAPSVERRGGLEIVDLDLNVIEDISDDLAGGSVDRNSYAILHGTAKFLISRQIDWGGDLLRPYITLSDGVVSARFNLGVYHPTTPENPLDQSPPTFDVDGFDVLLRLSQSIGDAYSIAAGVGYLTKVEEILTGRGYTRYLIDQQSAAVVAPTSRVWAFDDSLTWLTVVNDLLGSIGYAGIWSDWDGRLHVEPYQLPVERAPEWYYSDDPDTTMLTTERSLQHDYFNAPNRWVIYRSNNIEAGAPVEGNGVYTYVNDSVGETSVQARRGLVITRMEGVDAADQSSLIARANQIIDSDMQIPTLLPIKVAMNPLHWHFDRLLIQDSAAIPVADVMCTQWTLPLPPDLGQQQLTLRVLSQ